MPTTREERPTLSVAIPLYDEEAVLPTLYARLTAALAGEPSYEIVFVNDGSADGTLAQLRQLAAQDPRVVAIDLSRNFGHQAAVTAGLEAARGDAVILMDGDLQDPPEIIPDLLREWRAGYQVVVARRRSRQDTGARGLAFRLFHRLFGLVSDFPIDPDTGMRLLRYGFDAVFSFSYKPLRLSWLFGFVVSVFAFIYGAVLVVMRVLSINVVLGFTTPTVAIFFLSGIQLITIGILGEYLGRIYDEVKRRPHYIVAERISQMDEASPPVPTASE
jgi:polyisoprenyl-phosphate glycosyltransferase